MIEIGRQWELTKGIRGDHYENRENRSQESLWNISS